MLFAMAFPWRNIFKNNLVLFQWGALSVYIYVMFDIFLYYKNLPVMDQSLTKNRPYLIDTEGYKLPDFDPFHYSISRFLETPPEIDCSDGKRPLTTGVSNYKDPNDASSYSGSAIFIHEEHLTDYIAVSKRKIKTSQNDEYLQDDYLQFSCCFQAIRRAASGDNNFEEYLRNSNNDYPDDKYFIEKSCTIMKKKITIVYEKAVLVQCRSDSDVFYRNIHFFVPFPNPDSTNNTRNTLDNKSDRLSVMIVGIDSVSRINMQRYFFKTFNYLKSIEAIDLKGFNKNFENTYPNLLAMLSGCYEHENKFQSIFKKSGMYFDDIPFLWKNFSTAGYTTIYGEDCSYLGTFSYKNKKGFIFSPTDYYLRPYMKAAEEILGSNKGLVWISACQLCGGSKLMVQHILDYAATASKTFNKVNPYFSLFWTTSLTHDKLYHAGAADKPVFNFLKDMNDKGYWNDTIVFFMSDHGIRYGGIRETFLGKIEESLPFSFILIPKRVKEKYPTLYENLIHNQNRLTTPFDIHETLKDILLEKYKDEKYIRSIHSTKSKWLSLFRKIPSTRTCLDADIPLNFCAGQVALKIPENNFVRLAANSILSKLNKGLMKFPMCYQLTDFNIKKSFILKFYENKVNVSNTYYEIQMTSYPGEALLEAIVKIQYTDRNSYIPSIIGDISRINKYGNQSYCCNDITYSKYCLCKTNFQIQ